MNDMINVRVPMYLPVRMREKNIWAKDISERNKAIHDRIEEAFKTGWKYCFDLPAVVTGIVCTIVPDHKIGDGMIDLDERQSFDFYNRFVLTTNEIIAILDNSELFDREDELKDLLFGIVVLTNEGAVHLKKDLGEDDNDEEKEQEEYD